MRTPHSAGTRRPRWLVVTAIVAAYLVLAGGTLVGLRLFAPGVFGSRHYKQDPCGTPAAPLSVATASPTQAPAGGGLVVVEKGFSQSLEGIVSIGAVVSNTSTQAAYRTRVRLHALRADGSPSIPLNRDSGLYLEIPVVLPGARVVVGGTGAPYSSRDSVRTERVEIEFESTRWIPVDPKNPLLQPVTSTLVTTELLKGEITFQTVPFTVSATACIGLRSRGTALLYRDRSGRVLGGSLDAQTHPTCMNTGTEVEKAVTDEVPPDTDPAQTLISVYCDVDGASADRGDHGDPYNR
jgi:hypothetical protein